MEIIKRKIGNNSSPIFTWSKSRPLIISKNISRLIKKKYILNNNNSIPENLTRFFFFIIVLYITFLIFANDKYMNRSKPLAAMINIPC